MEYFLALVLLLAFVLVYFQPFLLSVSKKNENYKLIFILNLLLGWTGIAWVILLIMVISNKKESNIIIVNSYPKVVGKALPFFTSTRGTIILSIMVLVSVIGIANIGHNKGITQNVSNPTEKIVIIQQTQEEKDRDKAENQKIIDELKARKTILVKSFNYKEDEFTKIGWYKHKKQGTPIQDALVPYLNNAGFLYIVSKYGGDDWIFHEKVSVKGRDDIFETRENIPYKDKTTDVYGSTVYEENTYLVEGVSIANFIAQHKNESLKVRFSGKYAHDFKLSKRDVTTISDSVELMILINKIKVLEGQ